MDNKKAGRPKKTKKDSRQRVSFSIPFEQWVFLQGIENKSEYIEKLIKSDLNKKGKL